MTTSDQVRSDISRIWDYVSALSLGQSFATPVSLSASEVFREYSRDAERSYEEVYLIGLRNVDYNIILSDYSFFQFTHERDEDLRFAYYPNPLLGSSDEALKELVELQEYVDEGIIETEEYLARVSEIRVMRHPPMIRYEYSLSQYDVELHPASHFHIGMYPDWRWGSCIQLSARYFALTVLRHLYPQSWSQSDGIRSGPHLVSFEHELAKVRQDCRALGVEQFAGAERLRLHFA